MQNVPSRWSSFRLEIIPAIALMIALAALYFSYKNYANGSRSPRLSAFAFDRGTARSVYVVLPFKAKAIYEIPISVIIVNDGAKSAKNVNVTLEISDSVYRHTLPRSPDKISSARKSEVVTDIGDNKYVARPFYHIPDVAPNTSVAVQDNIFADRPTTVRADMGAKTKDAIPVVLAVTVQYSFKLKIVVDGEDIQPLRLVSDVAFLKGSVANLAQVAREQFRSSQGDHVEVNLTTREAGTFIAFRDFKSLGRHGKYDDVLQAEPASMRRLDVSTGR